MGREHAHGPAVAQAVSASSAYINRLWIAVVLGLITLIMQVSVGLYTSSLALLSDSAHVFTDVLGVSMSLAAILVAQRAVQQKNRTFGLYRAEVLAALANTILLFAVAVGVLIEAIDRFAVPPEVPGLPVTIVAVIGLINNAIALFLLRSGAKESLNVRGAYLEVLADAIGSVGVLLSGLVTLFFGWRYADPVIGVAIGLFVLPRAWLLGRKALRILFQHAPERLDISEMEAALGELSGVVEVHDLHVWTLTSGMEVASAHLAVSATADHNEVLELAQRFLKDRYGIQHATLQIEPVEQSAHCRDLAW